MRGKSSRPGRNLPVQTTRDSPSNLRFCWLRTFDCFPDVAWCLNMYANVFPMFRRKNKVRGKSSLTGRNLPVQTKRDSPSNLRFCWLHTFDCPPDVAWCRYIYANVFPLFSCINNVRGKSSRTGPCVTRCTPGRQIQVSRFRSYAHFRDLPSRGMRSQ